jgi:hypothetical protein
VIVKSVELLKVGVEQLVRALPELLLTVKVFGLETPEPEMTAPKWVPPTGVSAKVIKS